LPHFSPVAVTGPTGIRTALATVVASHATHNTFYSIWSDAKERPTVPTYPFVAWEHWRSRLDEDPNGYLMRRVQVRLLIVTSVGTGRTSQDRDDAVEAADNAAADIILALKAAPYEFDIDNVSTTTVIDEKTQLDTGVILTFTVNTDAICLDGDEFPGTECETFAELILDETWVSIKVAMTTEQLADATADLGSGGECDPLGFDLHNSEDTILVSGMLPDPCGNTLELDAPDATVQLRDSGGAPIGSPVDFPSGTTRDMTAPDGTINIQKKDTASANLGLPVSVTVKSNETKPVNLPVGDSTVNIQLKDNGGTNIGSVIPVAVKAEGTEAVDVIAPDAEVYTTDGDNLIGVALSGGSFKLPRSVIRYTDAASDSQETPLYNTAYNGTNLLPGIVISRRVIKYVGGTGTGLYATLDALIDDALPEVPIPLNLKFGWAAGNGDTIAWTVTSDEAGTYATYTPTGTNGTITYSKNGGAYAALSGSITLAVSDTIAVRRTTTTNAGSVKWEA